MVNGANAEEGVHNGAAMIPNLDSIAQFRIITNNFDAEYGNYSGGQINVVTKSGTNQYHGTVFDFLRNTDLDARNYYSPTRGVYIQNQFGGTVGGPIKKNKIFLFVDYQGTRQILGATQSFAVPSVANRTGDLSDSVEFSHRHRRRRWLGQHSFPDIGISRSAGRELLHSGLRGPRNLRLSECRHSSERVVASRDEHAEVRPYRQRAVKGTPNYSTSAFNETLTDDKGSGRIDVPTKLGAVFGYYFFDRFNTVNPYSQVSVTGFAAPIRVKPK